jgi:hypothetical protein
MSNLLKLLGGFFVGMIRSRVAREARIAVSASSFSSRRGLHPPGSDCAPPVSVWLYRLFPALLQAAIIFKPDTLLR